MRVSLGQIVVLFIILFLMFGDFQSAKKRLLNIFKQINDFLEKKDRKKGI